MAKSRRRPSKSTSTTSRAGTKPAAAASPAPGASSRPKFPHGGSPRSTRPTFPPTGYRAPGSPLGARRPGDIPAAATTRPDPDPPDFENLDDRPDDPEVAAAGELDTPLAPQPDDAAPKGARNLRGTIPALRDRATAPAAAAAEPMFHLDDVSIEDIDQLWDWTRADPEGTKAFLGVLPTKSPDLFRWFENFSAQADKGHCLMVSIRRSALVGFIMLLPITRSANKPPVGTVHIYLADAWRGQITTWLPELIAQADQFVPGMTLTVITARPEWARVLEGVGFSSQFVLSRPDPKG